MIQTRYGLHLIKQLDTRQPEVASFSDLKISLIEQIREEKSQSLYVERLESLSDESFSASNIQGPASALDLKVQTSTEFSRQGGKGIAQNAKVTAAAFSESVLFDGSNSEVIELEDGRALVLHLKTLNESEIKAYGAVEKQIEAKLRNDKAVEFLDAQLIEALESAKKGELSSGWKSFSAKSRNAKGVEAAVLAKAFTMAVGDSASKSMAVVYLGAGNQALVRLDGVSRAESVVATLGDEQKVARSKSFNEYKAHNQFFTDGADIERN